MKRRLLTFALAVLTVGLLGSCSKINERIDGLDKRVYDLENNKIASVEQQITAINVSINELKAADVTINGKIADLKTAADAQQALIDALKEADRALGQKDAALEARIATLEGQVTTINGQIDALVNADIAINTRIDQLQSYVDTEIGKAKDWASATFASLTEYEKTADELAALSVTVTGISTTLAGMQTSIAGLDTKIDGIDAALQEKITTAKTELEGKISDLKTELEGKIAEAISASETSIKTWINKLLEGYYTAAQVDAKIGSLNTAIEAAKSTAKERIDSVAKELTALKTAVDTAKAAIRTGYKNAIDVAINKLDGEIRGALLDSIAAVNGRIEALDTRVTTLEGKMLTLEGRVDNIEKMVQSVVFVPTYSDGNATYRFMTDTTLLKLDYMISPASVAETLKPEDASILINTLITRAGNISDSFKVSEIVEKDADNGIYTFVIQLPYSFIPTIETGGVSVSLKIAKGNTDVRSEFVKVVADPIKIEDLTDWFEEQYFSSQGWNGEGTIRLYYGCYPGMDSHKYLTGWVNTITGAYREDNTSMYDSRPWIMYYHAVMTANRMIYYAEHVSPDSAASKYMKAQALTFRAYCFFQLSQLYCYRWQDSGNGNSRGIILRTKELGEIRNYQGSNLESLFEGMFGEETDHAASTLKETYDQIFGDLDEAISLFGSSSITRSTEKNYEPNIDVAHAVYAHAAIAKEDWALAAEHAAKARQNYSIMTNDEYKAGFSTVNREWIWSTPGYNELYYYSYLAYVASNATASQVRTYPMMISKQLIDQIPDTDIRRGLYYIPQAGDVFNKSTGKVTSSTYVERIYSDYAFGFPESHSNFTTYTYMQFKIRLADPVTQNPGRGPICLFRAADMYYLEAEAQYHLNNEKRAQEILVQLTNPRDPSYTQCTKTGEDLLNEIKLYRRFDCWAEGFDWFDCKRWGGDYKRLSHSEGGNFFSTIAGDFPSDKYNKWTWVYPDVETSQNSLVTTIDIFDGSGTQKYNNNDNPNWF